MRTLKIVAAVVGVLLVLFLAWGVGIEPRFLLDVQREEAHVPGLPGPWRGARVAVLADWQVGMWWDNVGMIRRSVRRAVEAHPDAAFLLGDFIYHPAGRDRALAHRAADLARPLVEAGIATYAVLGNHDWGVSQKDDAVLPAVADTVAAALEAAGVTVLRNEADRVVRRGAPLWIVGVGPHWPGADRPSRALARVPGEDARVVLMHNPQTFDDLPGESAPLALAGHTHGGQVRIPFTPGWSWLSIPRDVEVHADGWIAPGFGAEGNRLYVNRGIGFGVVPIRVDCPPELTLVTLEGGPISGDGAEARAPSSSRRSPNPPAWARTVRGDDGIRLNQETP